MRKISDFKKIYVAGHNGMVGSAIVENLKSNGAGNIITRNRADLDLTIQSDVKNFFEAEKPDCVFFAAANVGGILKNIEQPGHFMHSNTMMSCNVVHYAYENGCKFFVNIGSSCLYPKTSPQPFKEDELTGGSLEPTNEGYAFGKMTAIKMLEMYQKQYDMQGITVMPCNIFGIKDYFDPERSHVVAGLIRRFHNAKINDDKELVVWGTGKAKRELMFSKDAGAGIVHAFNNANSGEVVNIGSNDDVTIKELAETIRDIVGFKGDITWDAEKPEGMLKKKVCTDKMNSMGWNPQYALHQGIEQTYKYFLDEVIN